MPNERPALFATCATQGMRASDFCWTEEGELVTFSSHCDRDNDNDIDGGCGCRRSMVGLNSKKATTTFKVGILPDGEKTLLDALTHYWQENGWSQFLSQQHLHRILEADVHELLALAADFPIGTILEIRGEIVQERKPLAHRGKQ